MEISDNQLYTVHNRWQRSD